jgi:4-amino-4-deoxy-L-arabinose transferase-like glycosyltransferase
MRRLLPVWPRRWPGPLLWLLRPEVGLIALLALGTLARVSPLVANRFHPDEALYSDWALRIAGWQDVMLNGVPVDKPPLFIYVLAVTFNLLGPTEAAARLPSLLASVASIALAYGLGRRLYGTASGLIAAALMAASPYNILFSATALTDPLLVALALGSCWAASAGRPGWGGALLGLAAATKQQALFFLPLVVALAAINRPAIAFTAEHAEKKLKNSALSAAFAVNFSLVWKLAAGFLAAFAPAVLWDLLRTQRPGFLQQSVLSYGGLILDAATLGERLTGWLGLLRYASAAPLLDALFVVGVPLLLLYDLLARRRQKEAALDCTLAGFAVFFLLAHSILSFQVWDRYLLGLIPILALLLSRALLWPYDAWRRLRRSAWSAPAYGCAVALLLATTLAAPLRDAAASRFPIGGDHGAYSGIDAVAAYLRGNVPGGAILYHQALGYHFRFYLRGFPYLLRWYRTEEELAADARKNAGFPRYVVFPAWRSATETHLALQEAGLALQPVYRVYRDDGSLSFTIYRVVDTFTGSQPSN